MISYHGFVFGQTIVYYHYISINFVCYFTLWLDNFKEGLLLDIGEGKIEGLKRLEGSRMHMIDDLQEIESRSTGLESMEAEV